jgi:peptidoglycan/xylan/chitin deacetylase (PgdA/CDA1 family)
VPPSAFERQLTALLGAGYRPASAGDVVPGRGRLLHVTFDDAFTSVAAVLPVLRRLGVPATIFTCSSYAEDGRPLAVRELAAAAASWPEELRTMTWDDLRAVAGDGVEIGGHTVSHAHLRASTDAELERELRECRERIEHELGAACPFFAYPYGEQDARVRRAAAAAGYRAAFGLQPHGSTWSDPYRLPRVGLWRGEGNRIVRLKTSPAGRSWPVTLLRRARNRLVS